MTKSTETEDQLVARAQQALSSCNWSIGECAAQWTKRFSRGRTDADFGALIGLSGDQVYQRRRVWEAFDNVREQYPQLKWSHFYVALTWENSAECLQWANEMEATVAEMRAWRRAQQGDDLTQPAAEEPPFSMAPEYLSVGVGMVQDPDQFSRSPRGEAGYEGVGEDNAERAVLAASAARESGNSDYAPFGKGARGPAPRDGELRREADSAEQTFKKAAAALERVVASLTPQVLEEFRELPIALQQRFLDAVETLQSRAAGLS
jgi:hypothetical protein